MDEVRTLKRTMASLINNTGGYALARMIKRRFLPDELVVFMYHRVCLPGCDDFDDGVKSADPKCFARQLDLIRDEYAVIGFEDIINGDARGRCAIITFDDGYRDNYEHAFPALKERGIKATILLTTNFIGTEGIPWWDRIAYAVKTTGHKTLSIMGQRPLPLSDKTRIISRLQESVKYLPDPNMKAREIEEALDIIRPRTHLFMDWDQVREMQKHGITFGAHTKSHAILTVLNEEMARTEIQDSISTIRRETGKPVRVFASPNGSPADIPPFLDQYLQEQEIRFSLTSEYGTHKRTSEMGFRVRRIGIERDDDENVFRIKSLGLGKTMARLYLRVRG